MTSFLALLWAVTVSLTVVLTVGATVRLIRRDRPATPPGSARDWRDEQLEWRRLGIS
jgi:hypothetical protein